MDTKQLYYMYTNKTGRNPFQTGYVGYSDFFFFKKYFPSELLSDWDSEHKLDVIEYIPRAPKTINSERAPQRK